MSALRICAYAHQVEPFGDEETAKLELEHALFPGGGLRLVPLVVADPIGLILPLDVHHLTGRYIVTKRMGREAGSQVESDVRIVAQTSQGTRDCCSDGRRGNTESDI